jgi:hypothetical protein
MISKGYNTITAHLKHLNDHNEKDYIREGLSYLEKNKDKLDFNLDEMKSVVFAEPNTESGCSSVGGCPGSLSQSFEKKKHTNEPYLIKSELTHWPVQLHLMNPMAGHFQGSDMLLAADCTAFAAGNFHSEYLKGKTLAIACPKLDNSQEQYLSKIISFIDDVKVNTLTVLMMQVPCCRGLLQIVQNAIQQSKRKVPVKAVIIDPKGNKLTEEWLMA